jgi:hypothetical protein
MWAGALLILLLPVVPWDSAAAQQSAHFHVRRFSLAAISEPSASEHYRGRVNLSMVTGASGVCPSGISTTLGFWSVLGRQTVPVVLTVRRGAPGMSENVLTWSGQADEFTVYRSESPEDVIDPSNALLTTRNCEEADSISGSPTLLFYKVTP